MIKKIYFSLSTNDDIKLQSNVNINSTELMSGDHPIDNGLLDLRMGTVSERDCMTCMHKRNKCCGHMGSAEIACGIISPNLEREIKWCLKAFCMTCSRLMIKPTNNPNEQTHNKISRLKKIASSAQDYQECPWEDCGAVHPKIKKVKNSRMIYTITKNSTEPKFLSPLEIKSIFEKISQVECDYVGIPAKSHPRNYILTRIPIPPSKIRPNRSIPGLSMKESQLTENFQSLLRLALKAFKDYKDNKPPTDSSKLTPDDIRKITQINEKYWIIVVNSSVNDGKIKNGISDPKNAIIRKLIGKTGFLRQNMGGRRSFAMGRSTLSGRTLLKVDELGIPYVFAKELQVDEVVQEFNYSRLLQAFMNKTTGYPGSTILKKKNGKKFYVDYIPSSVTLEIGDILRRDVVTGDYVYINRQPTLNDVQIGVHRAVVNTNLEERTIQMNVAACPWYGADFDGDQVNIWVPHNSMSIADAKMISNVNTHLRLYNKSIIGPGCSLDPLLASVYLTKKDTIIDREHFQMLFYNTTARKNLIMNNFSFENTNTSTSNITNAPSTFNKEYSGLDAYTNLLRNYGASINYKGTPIYYRDEYAPWMHYDPLDVTTVVKNSEFKSGIIDKKFIGANGGKLYDILYSQFSDPALVLQSIYDVQHMTINFGNVYGCTISLYDMLLSKKSLDKYEEIKNIVYSKVNIINDRFMKNLLINDPDSYERDIIQATMTPVDMYVPIIMQNTDVKMNGLFNLVFSGSKGKPENLFQIMCSHGPITIEGKLPAKNFGYNRTSIYSPRNALSPKDNGYIFNNFITGMTMTEGFFSSMNARYDLINKGLSTAVTGQRNRDSTMTLQTLTGDYFRRSVKRDKIVQFLYGDDAVSPRNSIKLSLNLSNSDEYIKNNYIYTPLKNNNTNNTNNTNITDKIFNDEYVDIISRKNYIRDCFIKYQYIFVQNRVSLDNITVCVPVDVPTLITHFLNEDNTKIISTNLVIENLKILNEFIDQLANVYYNENVKIDNNTPEYILNAVKIMQYIIRTEMSSKRILCKITKTQLINLLDDIRHKYAIALIDYGLPIGILSAQHINEPLTQYMLDAIHGSVSGGTSTNVMRRSEEIFGIKETSREIAPKMIIEIKEKYHTNERQLKEFAIKMIAIYFKNIISGWEVLYESYDDLKVSQFKSDKTWIDEYISNYITAIPSLKKICLRISLNRTEMILKYINFNDIINAINNIYVGELFVINNGEIDFNNPIIRIYPIAESKIDFKETVNITNIENIKISGIDGVYGAAFKKIPRNIIQEDGSVKKIEIPIIETDGSNLYEIYKLLYVRKNKTTSNSVYDTNKMFGIEGARMKIVSQGKEYFSVASELNPKHVMVHADEMTKTTELIPLKGLGMSLGNKDNLLIDVCYGNGIKKFQSAAYNCKVSHNYGLSSSLITGQSPCDLGCLYSDVIIDETEIKKHSGLSINDIFNIFTQ